MDLCTYRSIRTTDGTCVMLNVRDSRKHLTLIQRISKLQRTEYFCTKNSEREDEISRQTIKCTKNMRDTCLSNDTGSLRDLRTRFKNNVLTK